MRLKFMKNLRSICENKKYTLKKLRFPLTSIFYKSKKIDLILETKDSIYNIKFISSLSKKKFYHFVDEKNYITYYKLFFALPMSRKFSESINFLSYHSFPPLEKKENSNEKYVILFNPVPNEISHIAKDGAKQITSNGAMIGDLYIYNARGFCSFIDQLDV